MWRLLCRRDAAAAASLERAVRLSLASQRARLGQDTSFEAEVDEEEEERKQKEADEAAAGAKPPPTRFSEEEMPPVMEALPWGGEVAPDSLLLTG